MKSYFALPLLLGSLLFAGCEATVVDRRPVVDHRYGYREDPYYQRRAAYYEGGVYSSTRPIHRDHYYEQSRPVHYSGGYYTRSSAPYQSRVYAHDSDIRRTTVNNTYVIRKNVPVSHISAPPSKQTPHGKAKKKHDKKDHD